MKCKPLHVRFEVGVIVAVEEKMLSIVRFYINRVNIIEPLRVNIFVRQVYAELASPRLTNRNTITVIT